MPNFRNVTASFLAAMFVSLTAISHAFAEVEPPSAEPGVFPPVFLQEVTWNGKYTYVENDAELSKAANGLPVHVWAPVRQKVRMVVLAVHGLTLHGRCYEVLARGFASGGALFVAPDMRGYGLNSKADAAEALQKIDNEKSYDDIVGLAKALKEKYPDLSIACLGESLGTSFCVRLTGEHPQIIDEIIVAAPTSRVNPLMYVHPQTIAEGIGALFKKGHEMSYEVFFKELVSDEPQIREELAADPLVRHDMPLAALLETQSFVKKTNKWAKKFREGMPVLILQGSKDKAMVPQAVTKLARNINSPDQTIRWMTGYSHLLLETRYLRSAALDAIVNFIDAHDPDDYKYRQILGTEMVRLGARDLKDAQ